ncbi:MAG: cupin domain-containing protein [Spirochaetes bacterium]|nr:cupin domain-containing protein [Spirochaetota bacterium]
MFINFSSIKGFKVNKPFERELKPLLSSDTHPEIKDFTFILSTLAPNGGCTDFHSHPESAELMIFLSGSGRAWCENSEFEIKPLTALYAPPGSMHKTLNTSNEPLHIACIFIPAISTEYIRKSIEEAKKARGSA